MNLQTLRPQFTVYVVDREPVTAKERSESIRHLGFKDTRFLPSEESALAMIREESPHLILYTVDASDPGREVFLKEVGGLSPETLIILLTANRGYLPCLQLVGRGLAFDTAVIPLISVLELVQKMDRAIAQLYFQYESEQLREFYEVKSGIQMPVATPELPTESSSGQPAGPALADLSEFSRVITRLVESKDLESTLQIFVEELAAQLGRAPVPVIYFKYIANLGSLLFAHAALLPAERFRGIGVDLKVDGRAVPEGALADPEKLPQLQTLMTELFQVKDFVAFTHFLEGLPCGVVVLFMPHSSVDTITLKVMRELLNMVYARNSAVKERHLLDLYDSLTGLYNRRHFQTVLDEEISRSRRLLMPVSLLRLDVDLTNMRRGNEFALRAVGALLKKTARVNDVVARTGADEFALLMPHTAHAGVAVKAERLRRVVESSKFFQVELQERVTVSCGYSEYPSFSSDAEALFQSADLAVHEARKAGGNQVRVAQTPPGFKMDFAPLAVPQSPLRSGEA